MVWYRKHMAKIYTTMRRRIHAVLLMDGMRTPGTPSPDCTAGGCASWITAG